MIFFTADTHFCHEAIIEICHRPFTSIKQHDNRLIKNYNNIVTDKDDVYILGDFAMLEKHRKSELINITRRLNGRKHLIYGNHDYFLPIEYIRAGFWSAHTHLEVEGMICVHDPCFAVTDPLTTFLCGHVHTLFKYVSNCVNVGVDQWNYTPVPLNIIHEYIKENNINREG